MKNAKAIFVRILALTLVLLTVMSMAVACSDPKEGEQSGDASTEEGTNELTTAEVTENPYDANGYLKDSLPEKMNFGNVSFDILGWNSGYSSDFYIEDDNGVPVDSSVYNRNLAVEERLQVKLNVNFIDGNNSTQNAFVEAAVNSMSTGGINSEYDLIACYSMCAGTLATRNLLADMNSLDYLDFEKPWWSNSLIEMSTMKDKLYFVTGDASNAFIYNLYFLITNLDLVEDLKREDPRQIVKRGDWTLDKMIEMTVDAYDDNDGKAGKTENDQYGFLSFGQVHLDCFLSAAGIPISAENSEGKLVLTEEFMGAKTEGYISKINNWLWNTKDATYNTKGYNNIVAGNVMFASCAGSTMANGFQDIQWTHGVLPYPKINKDQTQYYSTLGFAYTNFCIPHNAPDADMSAALIEAMASAAHRTSAPKLFEEYLKSRWSNDSIDGDMYDIIKSQIYVDAARVYSSSFTWSDSAVALFRGSLMNNKTTWISDIGSKKDYINGVFNGIYEGIK